MSNLPILYRNILDAIDDEDAGDVFLRLVDRFGVPKAENAAYAWRDNIARFFDHFVLMAESLHDGLSGKAPDAVKNLRQFFRDRLPTCIERGWIGLEAAQVSP